MEIDEGEDRTVDNGGIGGWGLTFGSFAIALANWLLSTVEYGFSPGHC